jgi:gluconate kinase
MSDAHLFRQALMSERIARRIATHEHFMPRSLLHSQFEAL